jgi:hypothetical protein
MLSVIVKESKENGLLFPFIGDFTFQPIYSNHALFLSNFNKICSDIDYYEIFSYFEACMYLQHVINFHLLLEKLNLCLNMYYWSFTFEELNIHRWDFFLLFHICTFIFNSFIHWIYFCLDLISLDLLSVYVSNCIYSLLF